MKKIKFLSLVFIFCISLSSCKSIHTGKIIIDENENSKESSINVEYIIVEKEDKDSLIKNIKNGKGAIVNRVKTSNQNDNKFDDTKDEESDNR